MRFAVISPNKYLEEFSAFDNNRYFLVLAHRFECEPVYREFFLKKRDLPNVTIILDNGACELGESIQPGKLLQIAKGLRPDVLVLPDKLHESEDTITLSTTFINLWKQNTFFPMKLMGVVQGKSRKEWLNTLDFFAHHAEVQMLGISSTNALFPKDDYYFSRLRALEYIQENKLLMGKPVHILGLDDSGNIEMQYFKRFSFIEGVDSSAPVVHGAFGKLILAGKKYLKIREYLPSDITLTELQVNTIKLNLKLMFSLAHHDQ